jgi:hypothetical protein
MFGTTKKSTYTTKGNHTERRDSVNGTVVGYSRTNNKTGERRDYNVARNVFGPYRGSPKK